MSISLVYIHGGVLSECRSVFQPYTCCGRREWKICYFRPGSEKSPVDLESTIDYPGFEET
jgi:hypothetical protein